ncbi:DNA-directed RNA polymerases I, II, and III subunit RPABC2 isoform X1 [Phascolarctos cinereus]|uniref:DNA-directed RNA polymerases I, II, and III subunit RPABC2 isoform X2 n=1 Tax=Phascolarctos cinereus TaxID=38626 RepID=A0A6P5JZI7_PHACI|nr:DNA-directed RNA polymerases I, II, and III subunit RPABC2 isoform X2 [Phascolarctos cinereus]
MSDNEDNYDGDDFDDVEEDEGLDDLENPEEEGQENVEILPSGERQQANQKRITTPYMTKYERARVLGTRALQIASLLSTGQSQPCPRGAHILMEEAALRAGFSFQSDGRVPWALGGSGQMSGLIPTDKIITC